MAMPSVAPPNLQFLDNGEDRLATGGAGVLHGLDRLSGKPRNIRHQSREQALLVEGDIADGAHGANIERGGFHFDLRAGLRNGASKNLGHRTCP